ncbi:MAG: Gfo/Idh/MocA family oxidoreductase [Planctomycetales bacterium]|nr:Gfo/Idh/MocA family oxidoreductase [Planctomycetales bacterium]
MSEQSSQAKSASSANSGRRRFLGTSATGAVALALAAGTRSFGEEGEDSGTKAQPTGGVHSGGELIRIGLIGCGGRGTGAAGQALRADKNCQLVAMADAFDDRLELSLRSLSQTEDLAKKIDVPPERRFVGFDAYKQLLESGVDVVLLATPPHFRPLHLAAAIAADKHVFAEKPVAVDAPGVRSVLETCRLAKQKNLSVVSGLCLRYSYGFQELVRRIHDGGIGDIHTLQANDYRGGIWIKPRQADWTDMHWQMRNWYYFTWLSGDFNVEQHVHFLDVCAWVMGNEYPVRAIGMGGRQVRTGPEFGNIFDHHSVVYEYANGAKLFSNTRQMRGCKNDMSAQAVGSGGRANLNERQGGLYLDAKSRWTYEGPENNIYQTEHDEMFAAIRAGQPINNGDYMARSTLLAIMGRMATYTGQQISWEQAMNSQEDLTPPAYEWGPLAAPPVAVPGETKFV